MATKYVKDIDRGYKAIMREIDRANNAFVDVGIFDGDRNPETNTSVAEYATHNEFGTATIPARPFMAISFDENIGQITKDAQAGMRRITRGSTASRELTVIGLKHQQRIQRTIKGRDILPKLADSTIAAKGGSTKTLVDTGVLVAAVTYTIKGA